VPFLESAEKDAHRALAQATESLARAHAVFAASLASAGEIESSAAAAAIGVEETKLQRAQATYDDAAERVMERKAEDSEVNRRAAYAQSKRAHDEALSALRRYEPLALEMLKLFSVLTMHADLAQADVEVADKARINPHARKAVGHLKAALEEHKLSHPDAVTKHIEDALHHLELAAD
jgi:UDP-glucose 4-epimerase